MRYDIVYGEHGMRIEQHFCREWDETGGCYGTNLEHGFSFEEAKEELASWHEEQAKRVREMTEDEWYG